MNETTPAVNDVDLDGPSPCRCHPTLRKSIAWHLDPLGFNVTVGALRAAACQVSDLMRDHAARVHYPDAALVAYAAARNDAALASTFATARHG